MTRLFLVLNIVLAIIVAITEKHSTFAYRNLYGFAENIIPLTTTTAGALKLLQKEERLMHTRLKDSTPSYNEEYDFIVIGAGSAGATIASRLSEISDVTVLLIEAGKNENILMDIPLVANYFQSNDNFNWKYQTEPSKTYCQGMTDFKCNWPRGKVMGGSSVLNYMIATRGHPIDYDSWANMGNDGWSYTELIKYFKKLESIGIDELKKDKIMHNTNGPVHITYPEYHTPLAETFLKAGIEKGYDVIDYNANQHIGFSYIQATLKDSLRMSSNRAYLYAANKRNNLFISKSSHVNKILIDHQSKIAYGVNFTKAGKNIQVRARKEVILSAGAIGSPQILMLSGIGPTKHLIEMKINILQDAPVGENLMDHIAYGGLVFLVDQPVSLVAQMILNPSQTYLRDYLSNGSGPFAIPGGCEALAFIEVENPHKLESIPNMELIFCGISLISNNFLRISIGISNKYWSKMFASIVGQHSWTIFPMILRPKSRGKILLRTNNSNSKPKIFANYLEHPDDVRIMIQGIRESIALSKTKAMQQFKSELYTFPVPGCEDKKYDSDEYWECAIRTYTCTIYHYSGTCKMASNDDPTGVVNPRLQVKGIKRLRVADASIMPTIISGHTNIPTIMIGEKLADMVKEDWGLL